MKKSLIQVEGVLKDRLSKINSLLDKLDERLVQGELSEAKYKELAEKYRAEADGLKNQIAEKELLQEVGLKAGGREEVGYQEEQPEKPVFKEGAKYCSNCGALIDERAEICPKCGVRVSEPPNLGEYRKAIEAYDRAIIIDPNYKDAKEMKDLATKKSDALKNTNNTDYKINKWKVFCQKCGAELKEDSKFCSSCGFSLEKKDIEEKKGIIGEFFETFKLSLKWSGRFSRRQFVIVYVGIMLTLFFIMLTGLDVWLESIGWGGIAGWILVVITVIFTYSAAIRRSHDLDKSGWYALLLFIPLVGIIIFLNLLFEKGKEAGETRWG